MVGEDGRGFNGLAA